MTLKNRLALTGSFIFCLICNVAFCLAQVPVQPAAPYSTNTYQPNQHSLQHTYYVANNVTPANSMPAAQTAQPNVQPFFLTPQEQRELDDFLIRWEKYSDTIKNYEVQFRRLEYELTKTVEMPGGAMALRRSTFGNFKYCASPSRFSYHVEGDLLRDPATGKGIRVYAKDDPSVTQEKIIINEKAFYQFDFNGKKVVQINLPPEMLDSGIAKSPLPLIFGAKAEDMKKRFSMKIVTPLERQQTELWLQVRPLMREDQQEFRELEIRLDKKLQASAVTRFETNGITVTRYQLYDAKVNSVITTMGTWIRDHFVATIPRDWTHEIFDWDAIQPESNGIPAQGSADRNAGFGTGHPQQPTRNEIPLY